MRVSVCVSGSSIRRPSSPGISFPRASLSRYLSVDVRSLSSLRPSCLLPHLPRCERATEEEEAELARRQDDQEEAGGRGSG